MDYKIKFEGYRDDAKWQHYAWTITIGKETFEFKTGTGNALKRGKRDRYGRLIEWNKKPADKETKLDSVSDAWVFVPQKDDVLNCLFMDSDCGSMSFDDFCSDFGYSNDSLKALDTYRACMEIVGKLRRALGSEYAGEYTRINKLREEGVL